MQLKYIKALDGVRAIAALSIVWLHFASGLKPTNAIASLSLKTYSIFQFGVPLFFVLSGFLITRILLATREEPKYFVNFYAKRSLRIFPLYYFVLLLSFVIVPLATSNPLPGWNKIWTAFFYLQNVAMTFSWSDEIPAHLWSLAVEEHFYLVWPFMVYFISKANLKKIIYFILFFEVVLRYIFVQNNIEVYYITITRLDELCIGALLAIHELEGKSITRKTIFAVLGLLLLTGIGWVALSGKKLDIVQVVKFSLFAVIFYLFVGIVALNNYKWLNKVLSIAPLTYTGKISYGLYIYHPLCFMLAGYYLKTPNQFLDLLVGLAITYGVATLSYYLFEMRFLKLKKYFASKKETINI